MHIHSLDFCIFSIQTTQHRHEDLACIWRLSSLAYKAYPFYCFTHFLKLSFLSLPSRYQVIPSLCQLSSGFMLWPFLNEQSELSSKINSLDIWISVPAIWTINSKSLTWSLKAYPLCPSGTTPPPLDSLHSSLSGLLAHQTFISLKLMHV